jgi:23S rRNA (cytosine1962-C5)-methyltransferase
LPVKINRKGAARIASGHPWVFVSDVADASQAAPGAVVEVHDERGRCLGMAHYSAASQISLRLLTTRREPIDRAFYHRRLEQAIAHRRRIVEYSDACRLVFSEADLLPGLIVDKYGDYLVVQFLTQGAAAAEADIVACLHDLLAPAGILARNDASVRKLEELPQEVRVLAGDIPEQVTIRMNGLSLTADLQRGQKTGTYLDQRENYRAAALHARGNVLDCFTSTGGFALHIARRATHPPVVTHVDAVDSSALALATARANAAANGITNITFHQADAFDYLSGRSARYDTVVLDPPAFTKSRKQLDDAARGYRDINQRALKLLNPGGILVTCSCSHHMHETQLLEIVAQAALDAGRTLRVLERRTQASDHPILLTVPETLYLKCLIFESIS